MKTIIINKYGSVDVLKITEVKTVTYNGLKQAEQL